jgi:hypothetical protein
MHTHKHIAYVIDDNIFLFKENGTYGTIIDFSRAFIIHHKLQLTQAERIIYYYKMIFPEFIKEHEDKLTKKLDTDFKNVYKIFSAIDAYIHTDRLLKYIDKNPHMLTHKSVIVLIKKINDIASFHLQESMKKLIVDDLAIDVYPNYDIIMKCFTNTKQMSNVSLQDIFFYNNELKYSLKHYETLPPRLKYVMIKKPGEDTVIEIPSDYVSHSKLYYEERDAFNALFTDNS